MSGQFFNLRSVVFLFGSLMFAQVNQGRAAVDFNREIRPILSGKCFACHGPDEKKRKADLRLDRSSAVYQAAKSGEVTLVPGKPGESELYRRITTTDPDDQMPPKETGKDLTPEEVDLVRRWIEEGGAYEEHWAFKRPRQATPPEVGDESWPRNPIDRFVLARLEREGLAPSPRADAYTLVRRVYFDLIGLPPTPEEADEFVRDPSPGAYERLVDQLLRSPHYGERWARRWLDLARYADTNGYEKDRPRSIWPYRDWVINALNEGMPFDRFTVEQIAGDMLPNATLDQRIATGFHRNTMLNEEGGIDPLEFRFHAMTDRVLTTSEVWLGLTVGCAQCHTHKYDPVTQKEYYQFMAFLNNADEPLMDVPRPELKAERAKVEQEIARLTALLPTRFPVGSVRWNHAEPESVVSEGGATAERQPDGSYLFTGASPDKDTYSVVLRGSGNEITHLRLEAMADDRLPSKGPGRTPHGNFVLSEVVVTAASATTPDQGQPVKLIEAVADASQADFPVANAIDGKDETGWGVHVAGEWNVTRTATFRFERPVQFPEGALLTVRLRQFTGGQHTLGRIGFALGETEAVDGPVELERDRLVKRRFQEWRRRESARVLRWTPLRPFKATSNLPLLTVQDDDSVYASGDQTKRDVYDLTFRKVATPITAIRVEALPDERLPMHGPGRVYYEGPAGDFTLTELTLKVGGEAVKLASASHSYANGNFTAAAAIDGHPQTGWSISGGQGRAHNAVFRLAEPLEAADELNLQMVFERHYSAGLGRFRVSVTSDTGEVPVSDRTAELERLLLLPERRLTVREQERLFEHFLMVTPELAGARAEIEDLRGSVPSYPTTLVMAERPAENPRPTYLHRRGEFLQPVEQVTPAPLEVLPGMSEGMATNRLGFARWLVSSENPLVGRVTMNRQWAVFFGRGLVRTPRDFGFQGAPPTHPELLDWLAVEFANRGWSMKAMHKLIVLSATYQQASRATPELLARDPGNELLARGGRARLEAELIRDAALRYSGLLSAKVGGPSVFPRQPAGVTTEGAYGKLVWNVSEGADRYRRGLYTFAKRTMPFALFATFDAPSGEACVIQREISNTPLQALSLLNDGVFMEAAQALGRTLTARGGSIQERVTHLFRRCLTRPPTEAEAGALAEFYERQLGRFESGELDAGQVAGEGEGSVNERAAWTALARALLNFDEAITKS